MVASTQFQTQRVGALPVIARFCQRLQLGATVDRLVPWEGEVPLGDLVEILVANRLLEPKALYRLGSWATQATLADSYNLTEQQLHDDRIGRAVHRRIPARNGSRGSISSVASAVMYAEPVIEGTMLEGAMAYGEMNALFRQAERMGDRL